MISNSCKLKATSDLTQKPSKLICQEIAKADLTSADIALIRQCLYRSRRPSLPPLPKSLSDVHEALDSVDIQTNRKEEFLLENDKINNIVIFSCKTNLEFLVQCDSVYVDGTFEYCTKHFTQLFTVHGMKNSTQPPLFIAC